MSTGFDRRSLHIHGERDHHHHGEHHDADASDLAPVPVVPLDVAAVRARLATEKGPAYWRSLDELAQSEAFVDLLHREFPRQAAIWDDNLSRRRFLSLAGASLALAGLASCSPRKLEKIVPYVKQPEDLVPGKPLYFASSFVLGGHATGVLVESHTGRPTKIEGNPDHPASRGASDIHAQASVLALYDPDRAQVVTRRGETSTWPLFAAEMDAVMKAHRALKGAGLVLLTEAVGAPALAGQIAALRAELPLMRWVEYEPGARTAATTGARRAFGAPVDVRYDLTPAQRILALDSDFLATGPGAIAYARDFAAARRVAHGAGEPAMNRLYAVESMPTATGTLADHRIPLRASAIEAFTLAVAADLGVDGAAAPSLDPELARAAAAIARDLAAHRGASLVVAGDTLPAELHTLVHGMNAVLGNLGATVIAIDPVMPRPGAEPATLAELVQDLRAGKVDTLLILGGNPVYNAPADLDFATAMDKARLCVHLSLYADETAENCHWHIPEAHYLEAWSDARAHDGTHSIGQPLIEPLYGGKSAPEVLAALAGQPAAKGLDLLRAEVRRLYPAVTDFEAFWRRSLHDGVILESAAPARAVAVDPAAVVAAAVALAARSRPADAAAIELNLRLDPTVHDGRFANLGWLQELPKPWTRLTWDNAVLMSPRTAEALGVKNEDVLTVRAGERAVEGPAWILPGHADGAVTIHLGYGRSRAGHVGDGAGFNAYPLRTSEAPWHLAAVAVEKTGRHHELASTQDHWSMEGRPFVRSASLAEYVAHPEFAHAIAEDPPKDLSLYPGFTYEGNAWGMAIDFGSCLGCNACVVACQAENNIPVVGKSQVLNGREMHWIRIDRYFGGDLDRPTIDHQPVLCMHCEQAPCEPVCPVTATAHSDEGLNDMAYNRCIGTRYCSNNCPYKVRRFNWLQYTDKKTPVFDLMRNPDVTVRNRGVMEKCSYCVQRINHARIAATREDRPIRDGEVVTACQQACPTEAIIFGNLNDPASAVARWKGDPRNYGILTELNTRPRTTYLAKLRNPNPELEGVAG